MRNNGTDDIEIKGALVFQTEVENKKEEIIKELRRFVPDKTKKYIYVTEKPMTGNQINKLMGL